MKEVLYVDRSEQGEPPGPPVPRPRRPSPALVGQIGRRRIRDEPGLSNLLDVLREVQCEVASLGATATSEAEPHLPSIGISGEIRVPPELRQEFLGELRAMLLDLFTRYGGVEGDAFRLAVACYPHIPLETTP